MHTLHSLNTRAESKCELCRADEALQIYPVPPYTSDNMDECVLLCQTCHDQIDHPDSMDVHHWRCLNDSMWNPMPAVQVLAWRLLKRLSSESWAQDALDILYLDEQTLAWAQADMAENNDDIHAAEHVDSNGAILAAGDTITLIKDLNVKGTSFTAKRGTAVRGISLVADNPEHIEGRINGQQIVILTRFVKKS